jgi:DNA-binding transcriptional LysR family regulator
MTKDLEIRHCRALLAVADSGGVGAAARALGVAQSTVSETLLSLERVVGVPITTRRPGRDTTLTPAAEALVPHARLLVSTSQAALAAIAPQTQSVIRLGAVESISSFILPAPLNAFRTLNAGVDVRIAVGLCEDLRARVGRGELDAALTLEDAAAVREGEFVELSQPTLHLVASPRHALSTGAVGWSDLSGRTFLLTDYEGAFNRLLMTWLGAAAKNARLDAAGSIDGVKRGIADGEAIGVLPDYAVNDELASGTLVTLALTIPTPKISLRLTTFGPQLPGSPLKQLIAEIGAYGASCDPAG